MKRLKKVRVGFIVIICCIFSIQNVIYSYAAEGIDVANTVANSMETEVSAEITHEDKKTNEISSDIKEEPNIQELNDADVIVQSKTVKSIADLNQQEGTSLSNEVITENKVVYTIDDSGTKVEMTTEEASKVKNLIDELNVTADFAIYADTLSNTIGHEDGNIAVNQLEKSTTIMTKEQYGTVQINSDYALDGFSYVGQASEGANVTTSTNYAVKDSNHKIIETATLVVGNANQEVIDFVKEESGTANHFDKVELNPEMFDENSTLTDEAVTLLVEAHPELKNIEETIQISNNLNEIAQGLSGCSKSNR